MREPALAKANDELAKAQRELGTPAGEPVLPKQHEAKENVPESGHFGGSGNVPDSK